MRGTSPDAGRAAGAGRDPDCRGAGGFPRTVRWGGVVPLLSLVLRALWGPDSAAGRWGESGGRKRGLGLAGWAVTGRDYALAWGRGLIVARWSDAVVALPPCSVASRDASLFALDPSCARRRSRGRRDAGRPSNQVRPRLRRVEHRAVACRSLVSGLRSLGLPRAAGEVARRPQARDGGGEPGRRLAHPHPQRPRNPPPPLSAVPLPQGEGSEARAR